MSNQAGKMTDVQKYIQMFTKFFSNQRKSIYLMGLAAFSSISHTIKSLFWLSEYPKTFLVCKDFFTEEDFCTGFFSFFHGDEK